MRHVEGRGVDVDDAAGAVRDGVEVVEEDPDHLPEPEGHDREIIPAEPERRRAEKDPEEGGQERRHRQDQPEGDVESELRGRKERVGVGPDRVERHVPEVEQPRVAHHDVEPEREQDVKTGLVQDAEQVALPGLEELEGHDGANRRHDRAEIQRQGRQHEKEDDLRRSAPSGHGPELRAHGLVERGHRRGLTRTLLNVPLTARPARPKSPWDGR